MAKLIRIAFLLPSPTFGMHQYTADLANRMTEPALGMMAQDVEPMEVHLVTTSALPRDRYSPAVQVHTPVALRDTGFSGNGLWAVGLGRLLATIRQIEPDLVHVTGVHLWNPLLIRALGRQGIPVLHTLHDLDPHVGVRFGRLIRLWNRLIIATADHILVHGQVYRQRLLAAGLAPSRVTATPLLHLFVSYGALLTARAAESQYEPWTLFFGRLEVYKGLGTLLEALDLVGRHVDGQGLRLVLAGEGLSDALWEDPLPPGVEVRRRRIDDQEGMDLFRRCGLLVLPHLSATQSALAGAAYYFRKPVIVADSGALPEYVQEAQTGWIVPPGDSQRLADCLIEAFSDQARLAVMGEAGRCWYDGQRQDEESTLRDLYQRLAAQREGRE